MNKKLIIIILFPFLINSCKKNNKGETEKKVEVISNPESSKKLNESHYLKKQRDTNANLVDSIKIKNDSIAIPEFAIQMELSEKARKKLSDNKESVIIQAYFSGIPKDTLNEDYEKWGKVHIGDHRIELWNSKIAFFKNIKLPKQTIEDLSDANFEVLINVFSGRHSDPSNLLDCETIQESIDSIKGKTHRIKGKLLFGE